MPTLRVLLLLCAAPVLVACGDSVSGSEATGAGGGGSTTAAASSAATGGGVEPALHRPEAAVCAGDRPPGSIGDGPDGACTSDAECTEGDEGRCVQRLGQPTFCSYDACAADADCGAASVCACRNPSQFHANVCVHGNCLVDADCGSGGYCSPSAVTIDVSCMEGISPGQVGYFCHTEDDACVDDADCGADGGWACLFEVPAQRFSCHALQCTL